MTGYLLVCARSNLWVERSRDASSLAARRLFCGRGFTLFYFALIFDIYAATHAATLAVTHASTHAATRAATRTAALIRCTQDGCPIDN